MWLGIKDNPEVQQIWADRMYKHFFNGGALEQQNIVDVWNQLKDLHAGI